MGVFQKPDGRFLVGIEIENGNEYRNSNAYRDIVIQLTQSGATPQSMEYLAFLLDYATSHYAAGEPISPPNVNVFVSTSGFVKAIQADDFTTDGTNFEVGGIKWNGSVWDFSGAGQSSGGSSTLSGLTDVDISNPANGQTLVYNATSGKWVNGAGRGGSVLVCHADPTSLALDKTYREIVNADMAVWTLDDPEEGATFVAYLTARGNLPSAANTGTRAIWQGFLEFTNVGGHVTSGGELNKFKYTTADPDGYPELVTP